MVTKHLNIQFIFQTNLYPSSGHARDKILSQFSQEIPGALKVSRKIFYVFSK